MAESVEKQQKRVLVILSSRRDAPYSALIENAFRKTLADGLGERFDYYTEHFDFARFSGPEYQRAIRDFLRLKYAGQRLDVIITEGAAPFEFVAQYREEMFPGVPLVFSTENREPRHIPNSTGVVFMVDLRNTLDVALKLQPNVKRVFVISGASEFDKFYENIARQQFREYEDRVGFTYLAPMPLEDLLQEVGRVPSDSIIYFVSLFEDSAGNNFIPVEVLSKLSPAAGAPLYCWPEMTLGHGIVGGNLLSEETVARQTAALALRILRGENPELIPSAEIRPYINQFDWGQLRRWGISEHSLPAGSVIHFRELSFWQQYKGRIIGALLIIGLQALLIAGLLIERSRKRRAARSLSESEERFASAFRANPQPMSLTTLAEGRYLDVNESFLKMSCYVRDEIIGHTSMELKHFESSIHRNMVLVEPLLCSGGLRNFEMNFRTKDGAFRTLLSSAELLELNGKKCILVASSDITERKEAEQRLAELTGRLLKTQDEERRNIARELHDVTAQSIGVIMLNLAQLQNGSFTADIVTKGKLSESLSLGEQALKDIRTLSYVLHPPLLDQAGLIVALRWLVKGFTERSGIKVQVTESGNDGHRMPPDVEYAFYRVVQECLTNIRRHTNSETAEISLTRTPDEVLLSIRDQGKGIKLNLPRNGDGIESIGVGIPGMRHRLKQLGGELLVDSDPNGTTITATVPVRWVVYDSSSLS